MTRNIYDKILRDARVKLSAMFDDNFRAQGFFGRKWVATKATKTNKAGKKGSILIVTGQMRRSVRAGISGNSVVFTSDRPYTALHNEGGNFSVGVRQHSRTRSGKTHTVHSHTRTMTMPQRQFIGDHEQVQKALGDIVYNNLEQFSRDLHKKMQK